MYYTLVLLSNFWDPRDHARANANLSCRPCNSFHPRPVYINLIYSNTYHIFSGTWAPLSPPEPLTFSGMKTHQIPRLSSCPSFLITCCSTRCDPTDAPVLWQRGKTCFYFKQFLYSSPLSPGVHTYPSRSPFFLSMPRICNKNKNEGNHNSTFTYGFRSISQSILLHCGSYPLGVTDTAMPRVGWLAAVEEHMRQERKACCTVILRNYHRHGMKCEGKLYTIL